MCWSQKNTHCSHKPKMLAKMQNVQIYEREPSWKQPKALSATRGFIGTWNRESCEAEKKLNEAFHSMKRKRERERERVNLFPQLDCLITNSWIIRALGSPTTIQLSLRGKNDGLIMGHAYERKDVSVIGPITHMAWVMVYSNALQVQGLWPRTHVPTKRNSSAQCKHFISLRSLMDQYQHLRNTQRPVG